MELIFDLLKVKIDEFIQEKRPILRKFAATGWSFEEWLNWELYLYLSDDTNLKVEPKGKYENSRKKSDLSIVFNTDRSVIENKIVIDNTLDKYRNSISADQSKIEFGIGNTIKFGVSLVWLFSLKWAAKEEWEDWVSEIKNWDQGINLYENSCSDSFFIWVKGFYLPIEYQS